jgi:hypothetical protein
MPKNIFTNKFKGGDEVVILKCNYPQAWLQPGDVGIVVEVDTDGYYVQKKGGSKKEICFEYEGKIDFADVNKRQPVYIQQPINLNKKRLLLIKKMYKRKE